MDYNKLAQLLFPNVDKTPEYYEELYPARQLKEGARVTRFAPSPTGYLHIGGLFAALAAQRTASTTGGVFFLRIEDTDKKREVQDGISAITTGLKTFGIGIDEGRINADEEIGDYGPYRQSERKDIYQCFGKYLTQQGLAYPCFCSAEELDEIRAQQEGEPIKGYYGKYARCRDLPYEEVEKRVQAGEPWTLRLRSQGDPDKRITFDDLIRGKIDMPQNVVDIVLLKTDGIPTYHFAHCVDDHLMRTTHVVRGDEWIASVPTHIELFKSCGFKVPKYAHIAPIMKEENGGKRKLSKRKDPEAAVSYYAEEGYPAQSVIEYLLTLANSSFEQWRMVNKDTPASEFPFNLKKMSVSGALFDLVKLEDVSKNTISRLTAEEVYLGVTQWAQQFNEDFYKLITADKDYTTSIFNLGRGGKKPRKDYAKWSEVPEFVAYFFDETYENSYDLPEGMTGEDASKILSEYTKVFDPADDKDTWFTKIKDLCEPLGYTPSVKDYKANPEAYKGHVGDVSTVIRLAVTGRQNTPDLYDVMNILGAKRTLARLEDARRVYESK